VKFHLVDGVLEEEPGRIVVYKHVSAAEEYLAEHFDTYPVLPGVFMLEVMVQGARRLMASRGGGPWVLGEVRALRFSRFVPAGWSLVASVEIDGESGERFRGSAYAIDSGGGSLSEWRDATQAAVGRFALRPLRLASPPSPDERLDGAVMPHAGAAPQAGA